MSNRTNIPIGKSIDLGWKQLPPLATVLLQTIDTHLGYAHDCGIAITRRICSTNETLIAFCTCPYIARCQGLGRTGIQAGVCSQLVLNDCCTLVAVHGA